MTQTLPELDGAGAASPRASVVVAPMLQGLVAAVRETTRGVVASASRSRRSHRDAPGARDAPEQASADDEAVHDFRVAIRRLRSVMRVVRPVYGRARMRVLGLRLKRFADATGALRDEEVLRETLLGLTIADAARAELDVWLGRRARQERGRRSSVAQMLAREADTELSSVLEAIDELVRKRASSSVRKRRRKRDLAIDDLAARALERAVHDVFAAPLPDARDGAAMHALRIRFKRLRYAAELFHEALGRASGADATPPASPPVEPRAGGGAESATPGLATRAAKLAKMAAKLQKRLGELHDLDEALVRIGRAWGMSLETRGTVAAALRASREACAARAAADLSSAKATFGPAGAPVEGL